MRFNLPSAARHPVALVGIAIATAMALLFVVLFLLDALGFLQSPYLGLLVFVAVPAAFVFGLLLIPLGMRLERRRLARSKDAAPSDWPVLDLRIARQRTIVGIVVALTCVNLVLLSVASYGAVHYMETAEFCGSVCHTTMEPERVGHQNGPHARVACVECHVGPGVGALVESKMAGTRQLWRLATGREAKPVPVPVRTMRPARFTCENCHWPSRPYGDEVRVVKEYADDEANTETVTTLTLFVGGGNPQLGVGSGIHWHMNLTNEVEYVTTDAGRETIPYVKLRQADGTVHEYWAPGATPEKIAGGERRRMDCLDCHSRPAHTLGSTPDRALNEAMALGLVPRELPFIRREALAAITPEYPNKQAALDAIAARLQDFYKRNPRVDAALVQRATRGVQGVWAANVFPAMKVTWGTYPNHIGHVDTPGCFRCHDDEHKSASGRVIKQDCELCHKQAE
jgi:nitrate/TMAO reductase-like tetraheme cytochrome c subunit